MRNVRKENLFNSQHTKIMQVQINNNKIEVYKSRSRNQKIVYLNDEGNMSF